MIYLDYNATTPLAPEAVEAMLPFLTALHGNPSSGHAYGTAAKTELENARARVASLIGASPDEMVFTSGGSEANNHVLKGAFERCPSKAPHVITSAVEHPAILVPCEHLKSRNCRITHVPVDGTGMIDPDDVKRAIRGETILISIMHANNEVGTIQPIAEISRVARDAGVLFHTDAAQSAGKIDTRVDELGVDFLSAAAHKLYGPAGIGALYVRRGKELEPLIHGAGHEGGRRAGTEAVHNAVAFGVAADLATADLGAEKSRKLRDQLHDLLAEGLGERVALNGHRERRLPNTLSLGFKGLIGGEILSHTPGIAASAGAACKSGLGQVSHVLAAMGIPPDVALGTIRFSVGRPTTEAEIDSAATQIIDTVRGMT